jgi:hypothetical protein
MSSMHGRACFSQHVLARNRSGLSHLSRSGSLAKFTAIRRVRLPEPTPPTSDLKLIGSDGSVISYKPI